MTLTQVVIALSGVGVVVTGYLAIIFLRDTEAGLAETTHRPENLPQVMTDRYISFAFLALGATIYGDLKVIAWLFAAFAFMGFADAWIYARAGTPTAKHIGAGVLASVVTIAALLALATQKGQY